MTASNILLGISTVLTALSAGLFFSWSVAIVWGLRQLSDSAYVLAMQAINRSIQNPLFFVVFFGPAVFLPISAVIHYSETNSFRFSFLIAASAFYILGVLGVTIFGNVPMNNSLDRFKIKSSSDEEIMAKRNGYEGPWNNLNHIRTISATCSVSLSVIACLNS